MTSNIGEILRIVAFLQLTHPKEFSDRMIMMLRQSFSFIRRTVIFLTIFLYAQCFSLVSPPRRSWNSIDDENKWFMLSSFHTWGSLRPRLAKYICKSLYATLSAVVLVSDFYIFLRPIGPYYTFTDRMTVEYSIYLSALSRISTYR